MPRAIADVAAGELALIRFLLSDPIARIRGVRVSPVAVVGSGRVRDEVVARQQTSAEMRALEIRMVEQHTGIEHRDHDAFVAGSRVPGCVGVNRARRVDAAL